MTNLIMLAYLLSAAKAAPDAVNALIMRLDSLPPVTFTYRRVLDYKGSSYHNDTTWKVAARLNQDHGAPLGWFRADTKEYGASGYDGKVYWQVDQKTAMPKVTTNPKADFFDSVSVLRNNIFGLSRSLKAALKARPDCVQAEAESDGVVVLSWDCGKTRPTISVPLEPMQVPTRFRLEIDWKTWLPRRIIQYLEHDGDTITTEFSDWNLKPKLPPNPFSPPSRD